MAKPAWHAWLTALFIALTGCIHHRVIPAQIYAMDGTGSIAAFRMPGAITLIADSPAFNEPVEICSRGIHSYYAELDDLTHGALGILAGVFSRNHVSISDRADKRLALAVVGAECEWGFWTIDYSVRIRVRTGHEYEREFIGNESVGDIAGTTWAVEQALSDAVLAIFEDPEIVRYLRQSPY